jgi:hypothetical protein
MATADDIAARFLADIAGLGVPWWGWTALAVMIFFGIMLPGGQENEAEETVRGLG